MPRCLLHYSVFSADVFRGNGQLAVKNGFPIKFNTCLKKDKTLAYFMCPRYIIIINSIASTLN